MDLHLPDGSGLDLIRALARNRPRLDVLLATSGDPLREGEALAAGADAFLPKPATLLAFQSTILARLAPGRSPIGPRAIPDCETPPDPTALREDLEHAADLLAGPGAPLDYVGGFLRGVASSASDAALAQGVEAMAATGTTAPLLAMLRDRLAAQPVI